MMGALDIGTDLTAGGSRASARRERNPRVLADECHAHALEALSRADVARLSAMDRQALHVAVARYNDWSSPRPLQGSPPAGVGRDGGRGAQADRARGSRPACHGRTEWTLPALAEEITRLWGKRLHPASLSRVPRRLGSSKQETRPRHPQTSAEAQEAFKGGPRRDPEPAAEAHPDRRIEQWFEDEARVGQKGRTTHGWWTASARRGSATSASP
jgi:hypothetical protein